MARGLVVTRTSLDWRAPPPTDTLCLRSNHCVPP
ncbi:uncharacterized protein G2W53_042363 [Senna tora]|uniref:Uncharacterized protein n=1 Tax=Senna tora TaxID=362788 RepID=A0A834SLL0_9FABA|nr:uncharacterized protein G2W53_042363 [Senna tora]